MVISIIVMLILAGVSINAIIGDDGIISRTQYSTFLSEMTAVEEAVQMWKAGEAIGQLGEETKAIPANGLCKVSDLTKTERLAGEVGYYRIWSMSETAPTTSIFSSNDDFNSAFEAEMIYFPAGVQDLFYLNNETLGIKSDKTYVIDAATGMIYSMAGVRLKGISCYSANMATAVMSGTLNAPVFAESEVSGTGSDDKLAGNVQDEYLEDGTKNPDYNPYGFEIIADSSNNNIYKLYNNGDLYAKGLKGIQLNTSPEEMKKIDSTKWCELTIPSEIPGAKTNNIQLSYSYGTIYVIDENKDVWAWGGNEYNKLGLTEEQQIDYTGREPIKLNINNGKKVSRVFGLAKSTFIITMDNELYACGYNTNGELGINNMETSQTAFSKVNFNNPHNIITITDSGRDTISTLILTKTESNNKIYFAGNTSKLKCFKNTQYEGSNILEFTEIYNGMIGDTFETNLMNTYEVGTNQYAFILENKKLYWLDGFNSDGSRMEIKLENESANVEEFFSCHGYEILLRKNNSNEREIWCRRTAGTNIFGVEVVLREWCNISSFLSNYFNINDIKDINVTGHNIFYLMNDGSLYSSGANSGAGIGEKNGYINEIIKIENLSKINKFLKTDGNTSGELPFTIVIGNDNKTYCTGNSEIIFRNNVLQVSWSKIASNVKKFKAQTVNNSIAYIDNDNNIWVAGDDSSFLGMNHINGEKIPNFVRLIDYLEGDIYNHLQGKVEDYFFGGGPVFYIKTNGEDNNTVYVCGKYKVNSWFQYTRSGLEEDVYVPTKLMEKVKLISVAGLNRFILTEDNKLYCWGENDGGSLGNSAKSVPTLLSNSNINFENVSQIFASGYQSYLVTNENESENTLWVTGSGIPHTQACNGFGKTTYSWVAFDRNTFSNRNIKKIVTSNGQQNYVVLTEDKKLYGWGAKKSIGLGSVSNELQRTATELTKINNENLDIIQVIGGRGWFVIVTKDGKVYATGSNTYGILGRWIGIDRKQPNSRYKTAFDWVECPELEI